MSGDIESGIKGEISLLPDIIPKQKTVEKPSEMFSAMYKAATDGDKEYLKDLGADQIRNILGNFSSPQKNTILHIVAFNSTSAASSDHIEFAKETIKHKENMLIEKNSKGETPLHVAVAAYGNNDMVSLLIKAYQERENSIHGGSTREPLWMERNDLGETALHVAMKNNNRSVALQLLKLDTRLANCVTKDHESPLFLASERGWKDVVRCILDIGKADNTSIFSWEGPQGRTPLHAAVLTESPGWLMEDEEESDRQSIELQSNRGWLMEDEEESDRQSIELQSNKEVLKMLLEELLELSIKEKGLGRNALKMVEKQDEFGRTALHYAVSATTDELSILLLEADCSLAYVPDNEGLTPLQTAVALANVTNIDAIISLCPDTVEHRCPRGENILHFAVRSRTNIYAFQEILRHPRVARLMNEGDSEGNTPLHLAIKDKNYEEQSRIMLFHEAVNVKVKNNKGITAHETQGFHEPEGVGGKAFALALIKQELRVRKPRVRKPRVRKPRVRPGDDLDEEETKKLGEMLSLIATLIATVTFAAAFTVPGGYNGSDSEEAGLPIFVKKAAFQAFLLSDAIAMCCSLITAYLLVLARFDMTSRRRTMYACQNLLLLSLCGTMVAFGTGIYVTTIDKCKWLAILILILTSQATILSYSEMEDLIKMLKHR